MPFFLVHQNMRTWRPDVQLYRNRAYQGLPLVPPPPTWPVPHPASYGFRYVAQTLAFASGDQVAVVGLTEVMRPGAFGPVVSPFFPYGAHLVCIWCGITVGQYTEYVVIAVHAALTVARVGYISFGGSTQGASPHRSYAPQPPPWPWTPDQPSADYRGIAFVEIAQAAGAPRTAVGFLHNMYSRRIEMATTALQLGEAVRLMLQGDDVEHAYLGGDFNVRSRRYNRMAVFPHVASVTPTAPPTGPMFGGNVGATSWGGHFPIDYWLSDVELGPTPFVVTSTMDGPAGGDHPMSDHVAAVLHVP